MILLLDHTEKSPSASPLTTVHTWTERYENGKSKWIYFTSSSTTSKKKGCMLSKSVHRPTYTRVGKRIEGGRSRTFLVLQYLLHSNRITWTVTQFHFHLQFIIVSVHFRVVPVWFVVAQPFFLKSVSHFKYQSNRRRIKLFFSDRT